MAQKLKLLLPKRGTYSYLGQTPEGYCIECLVRHYSKVHGLMKEGERFSLKSGKLVPEARQRVRAAVEEMVTAEEDLGTKIREPNLAKAIDEIKVKQRDLRKLIWAERLTTTQEDIGSLRRAMGKAKELVDLTYRAAEIEECPECEILSRIESAPAYAFANTTPTWVYVALLAPVVIPLVVVIYEQLSRQEL